MTEASYHNVVVHKADVPLRAGESLGAYTRALSGAGRDHVTKKLNLVTNKAGVYMVEAFAKTAVYEVYKYGNDIKQADRIRFYAATFKRDDKGVFAFGDLTEVQRTVSFKPKPGLTVTKRAAKRVGPGDGWVETSKSFWDGATL